MTTYADPLVDGDILIRLSGAKQRAKQLEWLEERGIGYHLGADGRPRTTWAAVESAMGLRADEAPDFSSLG